MLTNSLCFDEDEFVLRLGLESIRFMIQFGYEISFIMRLGLDYILY